MAKLNNVKVTAQTIEVSGIKYAQSDAKAVAGDIIRFDGGSSYVTEGAYYEVTRIDGCGDPQIVDNDGDEWDLCGEEFAVFKSVEAAEKLVVGDYARVVDNIEGHSASIGDIVKVVKDDRSALPFRCENADGSDLDAEWFTPSELVRVDAPKAEASATPTTSDDIITHEGAQYRKVARKAEIGELVVVIANTRPDKHQFSIGTVVRICKIHDGGVSYKAEYTYGRDYWNVNLADIAVLEPLKTSQTLPASLPDAYVIHDGKVYVKESRKAAVGDKVVVTQWLASEHFYHDVEVGEVLTVKETSPRTNCVLYVHERYIDAAIGIKEYAVLVPTDSVTIGDVEYTLERRNAKAGENVLVVKDDSPWYTVRRVVTLGAKAVVRPSGHINYADGNIGLSEGKYLVLTPKAAATQYREVSRIAAVGERIKIVNRTCSSETYKNGDILTVEYMTTGGNAGVASAKRDYNVQGAILGGEYVVLEPISTAKVTPAPYEPKSGDKVRVKSSKDAMTLTTRRPELDGYHGKAWGYEGATYDWIGETQFDVIERAEDVKVTPERLKVGDYAKVIAKRCGHSASISDIVKIGSMTGGNYVLADLDGRTLDAPYVLDDEVVRATDAEVAEAKRKLAESTRLKVGEYARVLVSGKDVPKGGIVRIERDDRDRYPFKGCGDDDWDYFTPDQLERVPQADVDAAKPSPTFKVGDSVKLTIADGKYPKYGQGGVKNGDIGVIKRITGNDVSVDFPAQSGWSGLLTEFTPASAEDGKAAEDAAKQRELTAKWTAIGRKVGEIKSGDVVRIVANGQRTGHKPGVIGIAAHNGILPSTLVTANGETWCNGVELVAPVETLFNA